jgi:vitamin B12 transporter
MFTPAFINTPGSQGASSSVFLRGTNSYQTTVNWNGFLLNSLTLGTMDLSLIPAAAAQDIEVVHGASGSIAGSGNFGGSVLLQNKADWGNSLQVSLQSELGTHENRHFSFSGKVGNPGLQYQVFLFSHDAENNFRYTDIYKNGNPVERAENNAVTDRGLVQNLFLRLPGNHNLEAGVWYQSKQKEIPAIMGSYLPGNAMQRDSSLRIYAKWTKLWDRSLFSLNTAVFNENMLYRDKEKPADLFYTVDSKIQSSRLMSDIKYRIWIFDALSLDGGLILSSLSANVDAYGTNTINEHQYAFITAIKFTLPGFTGNASVRKEFHRSTRIPLLFALGAARELPVKGMTLKASYSDQFRVPSFNDKYWQPGGNPGLLPESGYTAEIGLVQNMSIAGNRNLVAEVNIYSSGIYNMIQWVPQPGGTWWSPRNRKEVSVMGYEASLSSAGSIGLYTFRLGGSYNHASSLIVREYSGTSQLEGNRLSYVPSHTATLFANLSTKKSYAGLSGNFTGSRFTSDFNDPVNMMPPVAILNSFAGHEIKIKDIKGRIRLRVLNLLNTRYQVIRSYPMPGRSFHLSFSIHFDQQ